MLDLFLFTYFQFLNLLSMLLYFLFLFTFNLTVPLCFSCITCKQYVTGFCFFFLIQYCNLCLLTTSIICFTFTVITNIFEFKYYILIYASIFLLVLWFFFSLFLPCFGLLFKKCFTFPIYSVEISSTVSVLSAVTLEVTICILNL